MRGKHCHWPAHYPRDYGSSPHARETRSRVVARQPERRLIPACAGNTECEPLEHDAAGGSSPHARETQLDGLVARIHQRLIPACAGNTRSNGESAAATAAHPRMRGKHRKENHRKWVDGGSSPHARETRPRNSRRQHHLRLIPACAGNTTAKFAPAASPTAHPRMRGKHLLRRASASASVGSSPHARETPRSRVIARHVQRLIPACAGNTAGWRAPGRCGAAHPRMRGKHVDRGILPYPMVGSSPHARETPRTNKRPRQADRLIPACAGNTCSHRRSA